MTKLLRITLTAKRKFALCLALDSRKTFSLCFQVEKKLNHFILVSAIYPTEHVN